MLIKSSSVSSECLPAPCACTVKVHLHQRSCTAHNEPISGIDGGCPANDEEQNDIWLKTGICTEDTEPMERHAHRLGADGSAACKAGKLIQRNFNSMLRLANIFNLRFLSL